MERFPEKVYNALQSFRNIVIRAKDENGARNNSSLMLKAVVECNNAMEASFQKSSPQQQQQQQQPYENSDDPKLEETIELLKETLVSLAVFNTEQEPSSSIPNIPAVIQILRLTKNYARWCLSSNIPTATFDPLHSDNLLQLYTQLISASSSSSGGQNNNPELCRQACLALFYTTHGPRTTSPAATFTTTKSPQEYVVQQLHLLDLILQVLQHYTNQSSVQLCAVRLLHNYVVSLPAFSKQVLASSETSVLQLLWDILTEQCLPSLHQARNFDLAMESLSVLYALKARPLTQTAMDAILSSDGISSSSLHHRVALAFLPILMDTPDISSSNSNNVTLRQSHLDMMLQTLLPSQLSAVVDHTLVGPAAISAIVPLLVILQRQCLLSDNVQQQVKQFVFPLDQEQHFQTLVAQQQQQQSASEDPSSFSSSFRKNMSPLDAPRGTLRWKFIRLLTWTESHVKRAASELLWVLCDSSVQEFVYRVGFGNGLPTLTNRGFCLE